ncbi:PaaI family thioesterase [Methylobacterium sp. J-030]|uniref:PaaI family thioesterase n=1 Tax=Methylobacterium sp. J-030 TaxID=2836627 RepID=UPI001FB94EF9|nr:PaaI family thioesterase [Methylobacterium sp. J-030]MCJ2071259.1 PaaI family thioesterase [Methylobacterium sp. J-030]
MTGDQAAERAALGDEMLARAQASETQEFGSFFLSRLLGFEISYAGETCSVRFEANSTLFNPQGTLHGGILATAMDISMGHLLHRLDGAGATLEMKVQYLGAVTAGHVRCEGSILRRGRGISFLQSHAFNDDDKLVAHATATWKLLRPPSVEYK